MKRILICFSLLLAYSNICYSQSTELKTAYNVVNTTFKEYVIGMQEFRPSEMNSFSRGCHYKKKDISFEYPNIIIEYTIEFINSGSNSRIKPGVYKVVIPLNSSLEYPVKEGNLTDYRSIRIKNDDGLTKSKDGQKTIIKSFEISSDEELTIKKFAKEFQDFQRLLKADNYSGKLPTTNISPKKTETTTVSTGNSNLNKKNVVLPTQDEIRQVNKELPQKAGDGLLITKVEYDEKTMTQRFYYDYTVDIDESLITKEALDDMKKIMVEALKEGGNKDRLEAGMTILYIYRSVSKKKLYEIRITSKDL